MRRAPQPPTSHVPSHGADPIATRRDPEPSTSHAPCPGIKGKPRGGARPGRGLGASAEGATGQHGCPTSCRVCGDCSMMARQARCAGDAGIVRGQRHGAWGMVHVFTRTHWAINARVLSLINIGIGVGIGVGIEVGTRGIVVIVVLCLVEDAGVHANSVIGPLGAVETHHGYHRFVEQLLL